MDGLIQAFRVIRDCDRLLTFKAGFYQATFIILAATVAIFVADMHFKPGDKFAEPTQHTLNQGRDMLR